VNQQALQIERWLEDTSGRYAEPLARAIQEQLIAEVRNDAPAARMARLKIDAILRLNMGMAELLGARALLQQLAAATAPETFGAHRAQLLAFAADPGEVPQVTFQEAIEALVTRMPVTLRDAAERTGQRVAELYAESSNIAFARATSETDTQEAQNYIARAMRAGFAEGDAAAGLARAIERVAGDTADWSMAYARTVFRTNVNTAVTAGRFRQAQDPDVRAVVPAFRFDAVGDGDTRDNHRDADGIILRTDNPEWRRIAPPLGYNCRCQVTLVTTAQLRRMGRIDARGNVIEDRVPASAFPDEGFRHGGRPDIFINSQA